MVGSDFWDYLDKLVATRVLIIDRPKNTAHPRYPDLVYPLDYGYLEGTTTVDGGGVDIWIGSQSDARIEGGICTVDLVKKDVEFKIIYGCSEAEIKTILAFHNASAMRALLIRRDGGT